MSEPVAKHDSGDLTPKEAFRRELGADGVLTVTIDVPGERLNVLSRASLGEIERLVSDLERRSEIRAVVMISGKPEGFIAGADIKDFARFKSQREAEEVSRSGQVLLDRLEAAPPPVVAAIHGDCLGGGLETALACQYRIASDDDSTRLGLPEVMLGLVPGLGGTQRLPRLVGLIAALDPILSGRRLRVSQARRMGLVDEVVPRAILASRARQAALELADGRLRPKRRGGGWKDALLRPIALRRARKTVLAQSGGHYPAPLRAIDLIGRGTRMALADALPIEAKTFGELAVTDVSRSLVSLFFATQEIKKDTGYPPETQARAVAKLGVLGAGLMGAGVAGVAAEKGIRVRIKDKDHAAVGRGLAHVRKELDARRRRRRLTARDVVRRVDRISPTVDYRGFGKANVVIEAVFEDLALKRRVLAEVEAVVDDDCVFATNTSSLPIAEIAEEARVRSRIVGMHFFSPVEKMPLVEVITTKDTAAAATATVVELGRRFGKHVIVVRDGPGFYTTRVLAALMMEAARLLGEGAKIEDVDGAMTAFGFPVGPITLLDEVGIDVGSKISDVMQARLGERFQAPAALRDVIADGRLGRKNGRGFYRYERGRKRGVDATVYALLPDVHRRTFDWKAVQDRLAFVFVNEAVRCLEEGILRSPRDGDVGAVFGLGFPPFLGGPFRYLDHIGARYATEVLTRLHERHGDRFAPAPSLKERSAADGVFHE